jgi:putative flippase GtrA
MRMPPPAMPFAESSAAESPATASPHAASAWWLTLGRHQIGAAIATAIDFGTMIALVEMLGLSPVAGTAISAPLGGLTNFALGRAWIFRRHTGHWAWQAARYALVSGASAGWNTAGEHLVHDLAHVQYVAARIVVSVLVSLLWNFPVQRRWVFRESRG